MKPKEIKRLRAHLKLSQAAFGKLVGVKTSSVSLWESGGRNPAGSALILLRALQKDKGNDAVSGKRRKPALLARDL